MRITFKIENNNKKKFPKKNSVLKMDIIKMKWNESFEQVNICKNINNNNNNK